MFERLLFGPAIVGDVATFLVRGQVLNIDIVRDVYSLLDIQLPNMRTVLVTYAAGTTREVALSELADLSTAERQGLAIESSAPSGHRVFIALGLANPTANAGDGYDISTTGPVVRQALELISRRSRPVFRPLRAIALLPASLSLVAIAFWIVALAVAPPAWWIIVTCSAALVALLVLSFRFSSATLQEMDLRPVPHRFVPISDREVAEDRANRRRDLRSALIGAALAAAVAVLLWLVGVKK